MYKMYREIINEIWTLLVNNWMSVVNDGNITLSPLIEREQVLLDKMMRMMHRNDEWRKWPRASSGSSLVQKGLLSQLIWWWQSLWYSWHVPVQSPCTWRVCWHSTAVMIQWINSEKGNHRRREAFLFYQWWSCSVLSMISEGHPVWSSSHFSHWSESHGFLDLVVECTFKTRRTLSELH